MAMNKTTPLRAQELIELIETNGNPDAVCLVTDGERVDVMVDVEVSFRQGVLYLKARRPVREWIDKVDHTNPVINAVKLREGDIEFP